MQRLLLLAVVLAAVPARAEDVVTTRSFGAMGTRITLTLVNNDEVKALAAYNEVKAEFSRIETLMSSWQDGSDVAKINNAPIKRWVVVNPEVFALIVRAQDSAKLSNGAFDITVGGFRGLWKFDEDKDGTIPTPAAVKKRLGVVGFAKLRIDPKRRRVMKTVKGMRITLGGIAKGYALDNAVAKLRKKGFDHFILQAGGDLYASGNKLGRPWRVGIRDPRGAAAKVFAVAAVKDATFSTSGDYERSVIKDGKRYHHILDAKRGYPADKSRSVTVMAKDALTADIWSTALFVMGPKAGMALVEKTDDVDAVFVSADNTVNVSSGLKPRIKLISKPSKGI